MQSHWNARRLVVSVLVALAAPAAPAESDQFQVNSSVDAVDQTPGDGVCRTSAGECTLRAAVQEANALAGPDLIFLLPGSYVLSLGPDLGIPDAATGDLDVTDGLTILGGLGSLIDGNGESRVFDVASPADVRLSGLGISGGEAGSGAGSVGGGIRVADGGGAVTVEDCAVVGNHAWAGGGIGGGPVTVLASRVEANSADFQGGGILIEGGIVRDSTVATNSETSSSLNGDDIATTGGSVLIANTTILGTIENFAFCSAPGDCSSGAAVTLANAPAGAVRQTVLDPLPAGSITMRNSIAGTCDAGAISEGYNLIESSAGGCFVAGDLATNLTGVPALLGPLDTNGGPTATRLPLADSPAIDAANPGVPGGGPPACEGSDQRGISRPRGARCDIGAVEVVPTTTTTTPTTSTTTTTVITAPPPRSKCTSKKLLLAAKKALATMKCHSRAVGRGTPLDIACVTKADTKFAASWAKEESKGGCLTMGDGATIEVVVDAFVEDVVTDLANAPGPSTCTRKKLGFTGKASLARAKCLARAVARGVAVDLECLETSTDKLADSWSKAEKTLDCQAGTGDLATTRGKIQTFVADLGEALGAPLACGIPGYPTCGGTCEAGSVCRPLSGRTSPSGACVCVAAGGPTDCPAGTAYLIGGGRGDIPLGCAPLPTCNDISATGYPACAGGVPPGAVCQPFLVNLPPSVAAGCIGVPENYAPCDSTCTANGAVCPAGQVCRVDLGPVEGIVCSCFTRS